MAILNTDPQIRVIGTAADGRKALASLQSNRPDVITMDIVMPGMNGIEATARIMQSKPVPIIIVSSGLHRDEVLTTFRALEAGALTVVEKPIGPGDSDFGDYCLELVNKVKVMAEVKLVRRRPNLLRARKRPASPESPPRPLEFEPQPPSIEARLGIRIKLVAIGASTGGPLVLQQVLSQLSRDLPVPILIVQHMAVGFLDGLVSWLDATTEIPVRLAEHGERALPGQVYLAPDDRHMIIGRGGRIRLNGEPPQGGLRPAVNPLFHSVAAAYGRRAIGVLLTGMGVDGADGIKAMSRAGAVTVAQDEQSSVVYGMPKAAVGAGAVTYSLSPDRIADMLNGLAIQRRAT